VTRDDITRMAREAGIEAAFSLEENQVVVRFAKGTLDRFAALVAAAEREACAKVCEDVLQQDGNWTPIGWKFADAIRARGKD
jgi:hypothetical protein